MGGTAAISRIVDVVGINTDKFRAGLRKMAGSVFGQERVAFEVVVCPPVPVPAGLHQHRFVSQFKVGEHFAGDRPAIGFIHPDDDAIDRRQRAQG